MPSGLMTSVHSIVPLTSALIGIPRLDVEVFVWWRWLIILAGALVLLRMLLPRSKATPTQIAKELVILVPAYLAYSMVRRGTEGHAVDAFRHARRVIELERQIGIFWEQQLQERVLSFDWVITLMNWIYIWGFWPVIVLAAVWMFLMHRDSYGVYRNAFIISGGIGLVVFAMFPVAPPRFMAAWGFVDTIAERSQAPELFHDPAFVNQFAAMPSLHFGWILLVGIAAVRHGNGPLLKIFGVLMPAAMLTSIVFTANHYIIDGVAGGSLALLGLVVATFLNKLGQNSTSQGTSRGVPSDAALPPAAA